MVARSHGLRCLRFDPAGNETRRLLALGSGRHRAPAPTPPHPVARRSPQRRRACCLLHRTGRQVPRRCCSFSCREEEDAASAPSRPSDPVDQPPRALAGSAAWAHPCLAKTQSPSGLPWPLHRPGLAHGAKSPQLPCFVSGPVHGFGPVMFFFMPGCFFLFNQSTAVFRKPLNVHAYNNLIIVHHIKMIYI